MRAVNLIPEDARRGGGAGGAGRSGGAAYMILGGLGVLVALVAAWAFTGRTVKRDRAELATLTSQVSALRARAAGQPGAPTDGQAMQERLAAVRALAVARTDWAQTLDAVARSLPARTSLSGLTASTTPTAAAGGTGGGGALASSTTGPSVQLSGCSPSQKEVAKLMPRLRIVPGVQHVSLVSATAADAGSSTGAATSDDCSGIDFQMVLFLTAPVLPAAPAPAGTVAAPAAAAPATTPPATGAAG